MPSIPTRLLLLAVCVLSLSLLIDHLRSQCLREDDAAPAISTAVTPICSHLASAPAAMPAASLLALPASLLRQASPRLSSLRSLASMPSSSSSTAAANSQKRLASNHARFTYRLGAASAGKRTAVRPAKLDRDFWAYASTQEAPSPPYLRSTKKDAGEDAFFATTVGESPSHVAFGVADGVGGWQDSGVDPSDFSHGLCGLMAGTAKTHEGLQEQDGRNVRPRELLQVAYDAVIGNPRIVAGGCTASLCVADGEGNVETANLGDSGFLILSPGKVAARSVAQTHAFNTPYQLSKIPPRMQAQHAIFGGSKQLSETPKDADVEHHQVGHGDIVLFATDGVWDNLSAQDVLQIVTKVMEEHGYWFRSHNFPGAEALLNASRISQIARSLSPERREEMENFLPALLAQAVMREAKVAGLDSRRNGPFAKEVNMYYPQEGWQGGKPDDIAVVVGIAVEDGQGDGEKPIKAKL
ncbi:protein serine/threonine phosphatase 2C [Hortaea werneckii]|uniref:Protein phosphatase n=1 Tax=Hortaea werneckii TaxID=91943 RepID=A0A3M7FGP0_HORWE|nr:protein serine/threonine phosphatase 2C [Hortaea werneckii]KAI6995035.1 protein serine/threonine phosphatase 2C [Hortaea werneckii]KAI7147035.1 protein serine/threonine phosphatase 2C [Hortaea werneckii]KAI7175553.1 protein serine/threonine phosphatase 2C [Hortaea werneckii]KAI7187440.1 protein serine/threonine phosphatase 2C [Hortaea werneckii]